MRSKAFMYIVEKDGEASLVKAVSPGRAVKAALKGIQVRRATAIEVADYVGSGVAMIDATKEETKNAKR